MLPYDFSRCVPAQPCADRTRCARFMCPGRPDGPQAFTDFSAQRGAKGCPEFIHDTGKRHD